MPLEEVIHVHVDGGEALRTDHTFDLPKIRFLTLRYEISVGG